MAKRFQFRIRRFISSFKSCRSKHPSSLPSNPVPSFLRLSLNPYRPSIKRHVSPASFSAVGCVGNESSRFVWEREDEWHVIAKVYDDNSSLPQRKICSAAKPGETAPPLTVVKKKRGGRSRRIIRISNPVSKIRGWFGSEERERDDSEVETLVSSSRTSSRSFSFEFNPQWETIREKYSKSQCSRNARKKKRKLPKHSVLRTSYTTRPLTIEAEEEVVAPARLSVFERMRRVPCKAKGKVRESYAVVKRSADPYKDFKISIAEMVAEKEMFEKKELEELLRCFLSLNSDQHHAAIVEAFTDVWYALFDSYGDGDLGVVLL